MTLWVVWILIGVESLGMHPRLLRLIAEPRSTSEFLFLFLFLCSVFYEHQ
jgi:hypothetical protein